MLPVPVWMHAELPPPLVPSSSASSSSSSSSAAAAAPSLCSRCLCVISPAFRHMSQRALMMSVDIEEGSAWIPSFIIFFQVRLSLSILFVVAFCCCYIVVVLFCLFFDLLFNYYCFFSLLYFVVFCCCIYRIQFTRMQCHPSFQGVLALFPSSSAAVSDPSRPSMIFTVTTSNFGCATILYALPNL